MTQPVEDYVNRHARTVISIAQHREFRTIRLYEADGDVVCGGGCIAHPPNVVV